MPAFDLLIHIFTENVRFLFLSFIGQQVLIWEFDQIFTRRRSSLPMRITVLLRTAIMGNWKYALAAYPAVFGNSNLEYLFFSLAAPLVIWWVVVWTYTGNDSLKVLIYMNLFEIWMSTMTLLCLIPVNALEHRDSLVFMYGNLQIWDLVFWILVPLMAVLVQPLVNLFNRRYEKWFPHRRFLFWAILLFYYAFAQSGALVDGLKSSNQFDRIMFPSFLGAALLISVFLLLISRRKKQQLERQKRFFEALLAEDVSTAAWCSNWQINRILAHVNEVSLRHNISVDFNLLGFALRHIDPNDVAFLLFALFRHILPPEGVPANSNITRSYKPSSLTLHCASVKDLLVIRFQTDSAADKIQIRDFKNLITKYHGTSLVKKANDITIVTIILIDM